MPNQSEGEPDATAVRTALWRALHVLADPKPHVFEDLVGLRLVAPEAGWQHRPDMSAFTTPFRASILARARFVEDLLESQIEKGLSQVVILGAGLDSFAQRKLEHGSRVEVFEVDKPKAQAWKRGRLIELGFGEPSFLHFVPVDFEAGEAWWLRLADSGLDPAKPTFISSTGVSMYLTREAISETLRRVAGFAKGTTLAMSFMLPIEMAPAELRPGIERAAAGAKESGTPFLSWFTPQEMMDMAREAGFQNVEHVPASLLSERYFAGRSDGLRPPNNCEEILVATV